MMSFITTSSTVTRIVGSKSRSKLFFNCLTKNGRFLSTTTLEENDTAKKPYSMFSWGTIHKGTIPVKKVLDEAKSGVTISSTNILNRRASILDHPQSIDVTEAFGIDNKSTSVKNVHCGPTGTAVILSNNTCYTFGSNENGQLGHGHKKDVLVPTLLSLPDTSPLHHNEISQFVLGSKFSAIIDTNGDLYTFGYNGSIMGDGVGCLGQGYCKEEYVYTPTLVNSLVEDGCYASQVAIGNVHMTVLTTEGEVLTCGAGAYGRCGNLDPVDQLFLEPVELLVAHKDIVQIEGGVDFTIALTESDGIIYAWGRNHKGQCGTGSGLAVDIYAMEPMPMPIEGLLEGRKVTKIAAGNSHAAAITDKGELFTWGMGQTFQPEHISTLGHTKVVDIACGNDYTLAVGEDGKLYSFGKGKTGVLGLANEKTVWQPQLVEGMLGKKIVKVSAGYSHVACLAEEEVAGEQDSNVA